MLFRSCNRYEYDSMGEMTVKSHYMSLVPNIFNYRDAGLGDRPTSVPRLLLKYRVIQLVGAQMDKRINLSPASEYAFKGLWV